ncbi:MAG: asparagine synthase, partial [Magnetospirillum sp.]|nr:asparagine synthase [Magnetospirillum sp.]
LAAELPAFLWANELPVNSTSQYAQYCVFRLAAEQGITVLLDGQGADELLGGYEQYFGPYLAAGMGAEEGAIRARYPQALDSGATGLKRRLPPGVKRLLARISGRGSDPALGLAPGLFDGAQGLSPPEGFDPLHGALFRDSFQGHLPTLLRYGDRNSMAHSREVRLPFCDHRLAELAFSLPPSLLMGGAQTKRLLRESMRGILPEPIRTRWNKQGFLPPQDLWLQGGLGRLAEEIIQSPDFAGRGLWNVGWWRAVLGRFQAGETALAWTLWRPLVTESWLTHVLARLESMPRLPVRE